VTSGRSGRWKLLAGCFLIALVWQYLYRKYLVVPYLNVSPPRWLHSVHMWMPDVLTTRLLGAFGLPVIFARNHGVTPLVFTSVATEVLIWAALFYLLALGVVSLRRMEESSAAA
jgi:hypothetical protein